MASATCVAKWSVSLARSSIAAERTSTGATLLELVCIFISMKCNKGCGWIYPAKRTDGSRSSCIRNKFPTVWSSLLNRNVPALLIFVSAVYTTLTSPLSSSCRDRHALAKKLVNQTVRNEDDNLQDKKHCEFWHTKRNEALRSGAFDMMKLPPKNNKTKQRTNQTDVLCRSSLILLSSSTWKHGTFKSLLMYPLRSILISYSWLLTLDSVRVSHSWLQILWNDGKTRCRSHYLRPRHLAQENKQSRALAQGLISQGEHYHEWQLEFHGRRWVYDIDLCRCHLPFHCHFPICLETWISQHLVLSRAKSFVARATRATRRKSMFKRIRRSTDKRTCGTYCLAPMEKTSVVDCVSPRRSCIVHRS